MLYRSPLTRYFLAAVGLVTGAVFAFGDAQKWRSTPSLHWLAQAPFPLRWWGIAFIVYAVLLLVERTRAAGYAAGMVLFAVFTVSMLATLNLGSTAPRNIVSIAAMVDVVAFHAFSIRTAWNARVLS